MESGNQGDRMIGLTSQPLVLCESQTTEGERKRQLGLSLDTGPARNQQKMGELGTTFPSVSLCHIGDDGDRRTAQLVCQRVATTKGGRSSDLIDLVRQPVCDPPGQELLVAAHPRR